MTGRLTGSGQLYFILRVFKKGIDKNFNPHLFVTLIQSFLNFLCPVDL